MTDAGAAIDLAKAMAGGTGRTILGITGPPGSGKSTLAERICSAVGEAAVLVPMDGFHLADMVLEDLGLRGRKGAPETFDSVGYAALLDRLRLNDAPVVYAPAFERGLEQPIAGAIAVPASARLIVTEGNYLLCDEAGWPDARAAMDEVWYCDVADVVRRRRLIDRHVAFGKTPEQARHWVATVDEPNARLVAATKGLAQQIIAIE